jgi:hypothetical protein
MTDTKPATMTKAAMIEALSRFIAQRSGMDYRNYGERESFLGDYRPILRHGRHARAMLGAIRWRDSITAERLIEASRAYSGRLQFIAREDGAVAMEYTTGQYFATEYRAAACAVMAQALWDYWREDCETGDDIRRQAKKELGRGIAQSWFS